MIRLVRIVCGACGYVVARIESPDWANAPRVMVPAAPAWSSHDGDPRARVIDCGRCGRSLCVDDSEVEFGLRRAERRRTTTTIKAVAARRDGTSIP